ncbi:MAG: hypothetical protein K2P17_02865 [Helicobacteraceae bacterium]|nr:hypothetical protein [Helicobacteraceae bacterium]
MRLYLLAFSIILIFNNPLFSNEEDLYIFQALDAIDSGDLNNAKEIYNKLYDMTKKEEYLREMINISIKLENLTEALSYAQIYQKNNPNNVDIKKTIAYIYIIKKDINKVIEIYEDIIKLQNNQENNKFLSNLYIYKKDYQNARKYLFNAYNFNKDEDILIIITSIDLASNNFDKSIPLLKEHFPNGTNTEYLQILIGLGVNYKQLDKLESLYLDYYKNNKNLQNAHNLARIYLLAEKFDKAKDLVGQWQFDSDFLIDFYLAQKDYKNAKIEAQKAYETKKNNNYLGILAIIDFEMAEDKKAAIDDVTSKLKLAIENNLNDVFYNYLGYLLIDYDIDVDKGIEYVKIALKLNNDNPAYLDSLAWGYYKNKDCRKAQEIMDKIPKEEAEKEPEIKTHIDKINKCLVE